MAIATIAGFSFFMAKARPITNEIRRMTVPFEAKAAVSADGQFAGEFEGYAAGIHNIDSVGDMILPGAFADDLPRFLKDGVVCWQHDWMTPIGIPLEAAEDSYGLRTKCRVSKTQQGLDAMTLIRDGVVKKLSIGYRVEDYQFIDRAGLAAYLAGARIPTQQQADIMKQYDEAELDGVFLLKKIKLFEYSPVTIPANGNAIITDAKGLLTGLTFADHSKAVLTAVQGLVERTQGVIALKQNRKTKLNAERRTELEEISRQLSLSLESLDGLLAGQGDEGKAARVALAEFLRMEARSLGCAV